MLLLRRLLFEGIPRFGAICVGGERKRKVEIANELFHKFLLRIECAGSAGFINVKSGRVKVKY